MSLLRFFNAAGETVRGLRENELFMGGLGLMSANQPGQATPVDQTGSFLKGMLSANALRQNRIIWLDICRTDNSLHSYQLSAFC